MENDVTKLTKVAKLWALLSFPLATVAHLAVVGCMLCYMCVS